MWYVNLTALILEITLSVISAPIQHSRRRAKREGSKNKPVKFQNKCL